ncbi:ankyrin repeat domain-containing protein [Parashewanella curva]|uniref:ankyrin repeat domain-containing protein n=1 Tax=Parashewanella curva TaxID=2338552 RepID=UPI001404FCD7|nr:ankyrin repeat domain-containing protein [Parashewanella curva]
MAPHYAEFDLTDKATLDCIKEAFDTEGSTTICLEFIKKYSASTIANLKVDFSIQLYGKRYDYPKATIFWIACRTGNLEVVKALFEGNPEIDWGVECTQINIKNRTPLYIACSKGNISVIHFLLDNGASIQNRPSNEVYFSNVFMQSCLCPSAAKFGSSALAVLDIRNLNQTQWGVIRKLAEQGETNAKDILAKFEQK